MVQMNETHNDSALLVYICLICFGMTVMHQSGALCSTFVGGAMGEVGTPKDFRYHYGPGLELLEYGFYKNIGCPRVDLVHLMRPLPSRVGPS